MSTTTKSTAQDEAQDAAAAPEDAQDTPEATDDATPAQEAPEDEDGAEEERGKGDRTEARLRKRAQAAEAERDALAERLTHLQRAEVERVAGGRLADGADVWNGTDLDALLDEDGNVSSEAVERAADELVKAKPHYAARRFTGTADGGVRQVVPEGEDPWAKAGDVIRGRAG